MELNRIKAILNEELSFYEDNAITNFAGVIARHVTRKFNYAECRSDLIKPTSEPLDENEFYTDQREFAQKKLV